MRAQACRLAISTHSPGECARGSKPGPNEGMAGIPAAQSQGASVAAGKHQGGGTLPKTLSHAAVRAFTKGCCAGNSTGAIQAVGGDCQTSSARNSGSAA